MHHFQAILVAGNKRPYVSWTFLIIPPVVAESWGPGPHPVRGTIAGHPFRGTASRGEGAVRVPLPQAFRAESGLGRGDVVEVALQLDTFPRVVAVPAELRAVFKDDPEVAALYRRLPPAHRRAWAAHVAAGKRAETRLRRARQAPGGIRAREFPK